MRVAIYGRVSTDEQAKEGFSIAAQREKLTSFVQSQDWDVFDYYIDEGESAKNTDRPELQRMLKDISLGHIDVVLVYRLDRLTRSVLDLYNLLKEFEKYNVKFKSATEIYETTTAMGRLFITLVAALAQWERENLGERVKFGKEQMVKELKRPGGVAPFGFDPLPDGGLKVNEKEANAVRYAYERYIQGCGLGTIAEELNGMGHRTKNGALIAEITVKRFLTNHIYYGALRWNYAKEGGKVKPEDEWVIIDGVYEPIVSKETFEMAQSIMQTRLLKHPRELASDYIFTGLIFCSKCGRKMVGKTHKYRDKRNKYYLCKNAKFSKCDANMVREEKLELTFLEFIENQLNKPSTKEDLSQQKKIQKNIKDLESQLARLAVKRKRWQAMFAEGMIEMDELKERLAEDKEKEEELRAKIEHFRSDRLYTDDQLAKLLDNLRYVWSHASAEKKKQLVSAVIKRMSVVTDVTKRVLIEDISFN
ncbi:MAG TPA: recombinase family protein [Candidatus Bathyarchaeia archaeon]|nr:recombinase family protein [Candidatus Bathyarchaeia archaeon]